MRGLLSKKKLGCAICQKYVTANILGRNHGLHFSKEWKDCSVEPSGADKSIQQASLRKKMIKHFNSDSHKKVKDIIEKAKEGILLKQVDKLNEDTTSTT